MTIDPSVIWGESIHIFLLPSLHRIIIIIFPFIIALLANYSIQRFLHVPKNLESTRAITYIAAIKSILTVILYILAISYVLLQLQINITPLFASAGIIGLIVGLGIRSLLEDIFTGVFILTQDTIRVGDYVEIEGAQGITETLGFRTVRIKDQNGAIHIFPNREIKKIVNYSRRQARVVIDIPIKPNQSIDQVFKALKKALTTIKKDPVLKLLISETSSVQGIEDIHQGRIIIRVLILTRAAFRWDVARKYRYLVIQQLEKEKILLA